MNTKVARPADEFFNLLINPACAVQHLSARRCQGLRAKKI
jgi:hypothetical protein